MIICHLWSDPFSIYKQDGKTPLARITDIGDGRIKIGILEDTNNQREHERDWIRMPKEKFLDALMALYPGEVAYQFKVPENYDESE